MNREIGNMIRILLLSFLAGFNIHCLYSQELKLASDEYPEHRYYPLRGEVFFKAYNQVKGNAYLTDDWIIGDICLENGRILRGVKLKADMYAHHLLVYNEYLKRVVLLEGPEVERFIFDDRGHKREFQRIRTENNLKPGKDELFVEILKKEYLILYKLHIREILPLKAPEMPYIDEFVDDVEYYLVYRDEWDQLRLRRKSLIRKFPAYKDEIKQYARKNKLKFRNESDFAAIIGHFSGIIEMVDQSK